MLSNAELEEGELDQMMGRVRNHRGSIFVDDDEEIEEIIEVGRFRELFLESTITSSYGGNYIS